MSPRLEPITVLRAPRRLLENGPIASIGDIHGLQGHLEALLEGASAANAKQIVFTGDYVDRGPHGLQVLDTIARLQSDKSGPEVIALMGNHEHMLLNALYNPDPSEANFAQEIWMSNGGASIVAEMQERTGRRPNCYQDLLNETQGRLIQQLRPYHALDNLAFIHAGLDPAIMIRRTDLAKAADFNRFTHLRSIVERHHPLWMREAFLEYDPPPASTVTRDQWHGGYFLVHGHTPSSRKSLERDISKFRVNLDGGSYRSGKVRMAVFNDDQIMILEACT